MLENTNLLSVDLLKRKLTHFVLWRPGASDPAPKLFIGLSTQPTSEFKEIPFQAAEFPDLWQIPAADCDLKDGQVYYYWFKVRNTEPYAGKTNEVLYCTDPMAYTVDRSKLPPTPQDVPPGLTGASNNNLSYPASVILYKNGNLHAYALPRY